MINTSRLKLEIQNDLTKIKEGIIIPKGNGKYIFIAPSRVRSNLSRKLTIKAMKIIDFLLLQEVYYIHTASRFILDKLLERGVNNLVIGKNKGWKQEINLGKKTNQNFVLISHIRLINQLLYKGKLVGIKVTITEESYTSKCSFLNLEPITKHDTSVDKGTQRGLFKSSDGIEYNADLNGLLNLLRKVAGNSIFDRKLVRRLVVSPVRFTPYKA